MAILGVDHGLVHLRREPCGHLVEPVSAARHPRGRPSDRKGWPSANDWALSLSLSLSLFLASRHGDGQSPAAREATMTDGAKRPERQGTSLKLRRRRWLRIDAERGPEKMRTAPRSTWNRPRKPTKLRFARRRSPRDGSAGHTISASCACAPFMGGVKPLSTSVSPADASGRQRSAPKRHRHGARASA